MRRWIIAATAATLMAAAAAAERQPPDGFFERMDALVAWIGENSDYPAALERYPQVVFLPGDALNERYYEGATRTAYGARNRIKAFYRDGTMYLADNFTPGEHDYVLLHELVHHLQYAEERTFRCKAEQEREAYRLQIQFVEETGRGQVPNALFMAVLRCHNG